MIETDRLIAPTAIDREDQLDRAVRPRSLADYVGQPVVREQMEIFIGAAKKYNEHRMAAKGAPLQSEAI